MDPCAGLAIQIFSDAATQRYSKSCAILGQLLKFQTLRHFLRKGLSEYRVPDIKYRYLVSVCAHGEKNVLVRFCYEAPEMFRLPEA